ncbi:MAG: hypothetical protein SCH98_08245 [Deferrisomatales bacterium]|nr:hypothetical protein [Deferrisomatales bacterium]
MTYRSPEVKPCEIQWLGTMPSHWSCRRLKHIASVALSSVDKKSHEQEEAVRLCNYVDVYYHERITSELDFMQATATPDEVRRFTLRSGDVLITKDSEAWDDIAVPAYVPADIEGVLCGYHLAQVRPLNGLVDGEYLSRAFAARGINDQFRIAANGITRFGIGKHWIDNSLFLLPPVDEQRAIAAFLDRETARVDALIEKKRRQIELLHEKRAALISHAVTKGLDPTAPMKDPGIDWLGRIPRSWRVLQFRRVIGALEQGWSPVAEDREAEAEEWAVLKISAVAQGCFRPSEHKALPPSLEPEMRYEVRPGDLLLTRSNTPEKVGDACYVRETRHRLLMSDLIYRIHLDQRTCLHPYACYWLISRPGRAAIEADARGTSGSMVKIAQRHIRAWPFLVPPVEEQSAIVRYLDREMSRLGVIAGKIETSIDRLREYRTALISAAVTGKLDVREAIA